VRSISWSIWSALLTFPADSSFEIDVISWSAPLQGVAQIFGGEMQASRISIAVALIPGYLSVTFKI
jgi:hypothetical protein